MVPSIIPRSKKLWLVVEMPDCCNWVKHTEDKHNLCFSFKKQKISIKKKTRNTHNDEDMLKRYGRPVKNLKQFDQQNNKVV